MGDWLNGKSPKMWVNEICVKLLIRPNWETREAHPGQQPPTFICRCTINYTDRKLEAEGVGKTKKEAEQEAALEMLKGSSNLAMTPAKLLLLDNNSKRKSGNTSAPSLSSSSNSVSAGSRDEGGVSDTDDNEAADQNSVGELIAICDQNEFQEPDYEEVSSEGPPHKKIFTLRCTIKDLGISFCARRYTKKLAKRVASYRVLKEIKKQGFKYTPHEEAESSSNGKVDVDVANGSPSQQKWIIDNIINEEVLNFKTISLEDQGAEEGKLLGSRMYCNDKSEKCVEYCVDYAHAFQHLKQSETLDKILSMPWSESLSEFGGPIRTLEKVTGELGIKIRFLSDTLNIGAGLEFLAFVELRIPFRFSKSKVPPNAVFHGAGITERDAREESAARATKFLISLITESK